MHVCVQPCICVCVWCAVHACMCMCLCVSVYPNDECTACMQNSTTINIILPAYHQSALPHEPFALLSKIANPMFLMPDRSSTISCYSNSNCEISWFTVHNKVK